MITPEILRVFSGGLHALWKSWAGISNQRGDIIIPSRREFRMTRPEDKTRPETGGFLSLPFDAPADPREDPRPKRKGRPNGTALPS